MKKRTLIIYICLVLALISCKKESAVPETVATAVATKPTQENFTEFHSKLINDSVFRYSRINFPIMGYNSDADKEPDIIPGLKKIGLFILKKMLSINKTKI